MPPAASYDPEVRPPAPVRVFLEDSKTYVLREGDFTICTAEWDVAIQTGNLVISSTSGSWHVPDAYFQTITKATHTDGRVVDLAYTAMPNGNGLGLDGKIYRMRQLGAGHGLYDEGGTLVLQTGSTWRDSERKLGIVCGLWPEEIPPAPLDSLILVCAAIMVGLDSGCIYLG